MNTMVLIALSFAAAERPSPIDISLSLARARVAVAEQSKPRASTPSDPKELSYSDACRLAVRSRQPLVVFVGINSRPVSGCVVCAVASIWEINRGIVVAVPVDGWLKCDADGHEAISETASDKEIAAKISKVKWSAAPASPPPTPTPSYQPAPLILQPAFMGGGVGRGGYCPPGG